MVEAQRARGFAYAEGACLHGGPPERHWVRESGASGSGARSSLASRSGPRSPRFGLSTLLLAGYPVSAGRTYQYVDAGGAGRPARPRSAGCSTRSESSPSSRACFASAGASCAIGARRSSSTKARKAAKTAEGRHFAGRPHGDTDRRGPVRDIVEDHGVRANLGVIANPHRPDNLRASADVDVSADLDPRHQRHPLEDEAVGADARLGVNDDARRVNQQEPPSIRTPSGTSEAVTTLQKWCSMTPRASVSACPACPRGPPALVPPKAREETPRTDPTPPAGARAPSGDLGRDGRLRGEE